MQIIDEFTQCELLGGLVSQASGLFAVDITARFENNDTVYVGNGTGQNTPLDPGDSMPSPGDVISLVFVRGIPTAFAMDNVDQGLKQFRISGDETQRVIVGDKISVVGSTGNDGFYTVNTVEFNGSKTTFTVDETIPDATIDGEVFTADKVVLFGRG